MICRLCNREASFFKEGIILNKYNIKYYFCDHCRFLQTEYPYWLNESYESSINPFDTGLVKRNIDLSRKISIMLYYYFNRKGKYLDYAGGCGLFTRMMRDIGFDFYWKDKYSTNILAKGFEYNNKDDIDAVTVIEAFEHFVKPVEEIESILKISSNIIFTTELLPGEIPKLLNWWYYGQEHGQHVSFYSSDTLAYIANKYGLNFITDGRIHLFTKRKINKTMYSILLKTSEFGSAGIITKKMKSKTASDMELMQSGKFKES
ncbi:MAG: class I SAM-dependent methyltransferase [Bacteroidetes bacterium]|nr:class I SAM-dependent methyltransferase [Bacteroidota bacterium]